MSFLETNKNFCKIENVFLMIVKILYHSLYKHYFQLKNVSHIIGYHLKAIAIPFSVNHFMCIFLNEEEV